MLEGARWASYLNSRSKVYINTHKIFPPSVNIGAATYPAEQDIEQLLTGRAGAFKWVDAIGRSKELGNPALAGVVMLGRLSCKLDVVVENWLEVIAELVPAKFTELNKKAFMVGREMGK